MLSKKTDGAGSRISLFSGKQWSITGRLTIFYTLSSLSMLLLFAGLTYVTLIGCLVKEDSEELAEKVDHLCIVIRNRPDNNLALQKEFDWEEGHPIESFRHYTRVLNEAGRTLAQSPAYEKLGFDMPFPAKIRDVVKWRAPTGEHFLLMTTRTKEGHPPGKWRTIQVAMDVTNEQEIIKYFLYNLTTILFFGIFIAAGLGFSVASKVLHPLGKVTEVVDRITSSHIDERTDPSSWPKELSSLAVAFNRMLDRIEDSLTRLSRFSSDLAHELRTPINNMLGEAEIAIAQNGVTEECRHVLESGIEELNRIARLIDSLLFLAKAENPETCIERTRFDVYGEVTKVCEYFEGLAEEEGVKITCSGSGVMAADPLLVRRAVSNLLANAIHHTPATGSIDVAVRQADDHYLEILVSDTGQGIPEEHLPHIFDRFYRADAARSNYPHGSGLGLAIVKSIMDLHKGTITIRSKPGEGTKVTLRFPCSETKEGD